MFDHWKNYDRVYLIEDEEVKYGYRNMIKPDSPIHTWITDKIVQLECSWAFSKLKLDGEPMCWMIKKEDIISENEIHLIVKKHAIITRIQ